MTATTKTTTRSAMQTYIDSVEADIAALRQGLIGGSRWFQKHFADELQTALDEYKRDKSCTVGMRLQSHAESWRTYSYQVSELSPLYASFAKHGLGAKTSNEA